MKWSILLSGLWLTLVSLTACQPTAQNVTSSPVPTTTVRVAGAMKNVMWKGELGGVIQLDTLSTAGMYGLGPLAGLRGEILLLDGQPYVSRVLTDTSMSVALDSLAQAPFFVYASATDWTTHTLPDSVLTIASLAAWVDSLSANAPRPFVFKLVGMIDSADIHIQNLPVGSTVSSPKEAHVGQTNYGLGAQAVEIIGFFSTEHHGVFTHHDSNVHLHLITQDRQQMGHLDAVTLRPSAMELYLPK